MSNEHQNLNNAASVDSDTDQAGSSLTQPTELAVVPPTAEENADASADSAGISPSHELAEMQPVSMHAAIDLHEAKRGLEAALLAAAEPMPLQELKKIFEGELNADILRNLLDELRAEWADRSVELAIVASGYRFRVKPDYQKYIDRLANEKPPKYSRAVLETMAIIAYRQPVTRSDIEDIRGVTVSPHILKTLEDRGWIDEIGHKDAPGRPALFATTKHFLDDLNLVSLDQLPPLHELQATLDMSQAGAALHAGDNTLALPGVASGEAVADADQGNDASDTINIENAKQADMTDTDQNRTETNDTDQNRTETNDTDANIADANAADAANQNATEESAGRPHENQSQEQKPGASS